MPATKTRERLTIHRLTMARAPLAVVALAALALAACLPKPDDPVEFVHQPDSIVIQMLEVDPANASAAQRLDEVPEFTLYGDGRLIYASPDDPLMLLQAELPEDAVLDLLEPIVDKGFLSFRYEQVGADWRDGRPTTYLYAHTFDAANAVRVVALDTKLGDEHGSEWDQFRALQQIVALLHEVDPVALGGSEPVPFVPDIMTSYHRQDPDETYTETRIEGEAVRQFAGEPMLGLRAYDNQLGSGEVGYVPILPYQENFPEFDLP